MADTRPGFTPALLPLYSIAASPSHHFPGIKKPPTCTSSEVVMDSPQGDLKLENRQDRLPKPGNNLNRHEFISSSAEQRQNAHNTLLRKPILHIL
ncbi:hypothetical protein AOLI_G00144460 [Acnodon oligacanthus]